MKCDRPNDQTPINEDSAAPTELYYDMMKLNKEVLLLCITELSLDKDKVKQQLGRPS